MFTKRIIASEKDGQPYLVRWSLDVPFGSVKLHHILRSDEDRDLHDHPWSFVSIILKGGYWEWTPSELFPDTHRRTWYGAGSVLYRPVPSIHRLELPDGKTTWSLVFTTKKVREWGFHTICGWIPWFDYSRAKQEGC